MPDQPTAQAAAEAAAAESAAAAATVAAAEEAADEALNIFEVCETDSAAEEEGRWFVDFLAPAKGDIRLRGFTSTVARNVYQRLQAKYRKHMKGGQFPEKIAERFVIEQLSEAIIVDWRGPVFRDKAGAPITFSPAAARMLLEKLPHLRMRLTNMAGSLDSFRIEEQEDAEKN